MRTIASTILIIMFATLFEADAQTIRVRTNASPAPSISDTQRLTIKLEDADLAQVLAVYQQLAGVKINVDPTVPEQVRTITIAPTNPVPKAELIVMIRDALKQQAGLVLETNGSGVVEVKLAMPPRNPAAYRLTDHPAEARLKNDSPVVAVEARKTTPWLIAGVVVSVVVVITMLFATMRAKR